VPGCDTHGRRREAQRRLRPRIFPSRKCVAKTSLSRLIRDCILYKETYPRGQARVQSNGRKAAWSVEREALSLFPFGFTGLEKSEKRGVQAARNRPSADRKCWQRVRQGIHVMNRWTVNCLEMSRKHGVRTDKTPRARTEVLAAPRVKYPLHEQMTRRLSRHFWKTRRPNRQYAPSEDRKCWQRLQRNRSPSQCVAKPEITRSGRATRSLAPGKRGWPPTSSRQKVLVLGEKRSPAHASVEHVESHPPRRISPWT
jgi:hypothetical protein